MGSARGAKNRPVSCTEGRELRFLTGHPWDLDRTGGGYCGGIRSQKIRASFAEKRAECYQSLLGCRTRALTQLWDRECCAAGSLGQV